MSNKKKIINYEFADGVYEIPATFRAICTKSGTEVLYYHKVLVKLIENKYKNSYTYFINNYVCPEELRAEREDTDPTKLNIYAKYLILCYKEAVLKKDEYGIFINADRFEKNFKRNIKDHLNDLS